MSSNPISLLIDVKPQWFAVGLRTSVSLEGTAKIPGTCWRKDGLDIHISAGKTVTAREKVPGTRLPKFCPERHIQGDKTFCMGLGGLSVRTNQAAVDWWQKLFLFLVCQSTAERTRHWPPANALDHGAAGELHLKAIELSGELGMRKEYEAARGGEKNWITDKSIRLIGKSGEPINGRAPCPRGCRHKGRRQAIILRVECSRRNKMIELLRCEQERSNALGKFWIDARKAGHQCCHTMSKCELAI